MTIELNIGIKDLPYPIPLVFAIVIIVIAVFSSIFSAIIPTVHFIFGRCQGHPTRLISIICLIDLILAYNLTLIALNIYNIESGYHIQEIFSLLTFHSKINPTRIDFCTLHLSLFAILESLSLCFNMCLVADLMITLTKPFLSGKSRQMFYYLVSVLITICTFIATFQSIQTQCIHQASDEDFIISQFLFPYPMMGIMILFQFVALVSVVWGIIQLKFNQKKNEARSTYIKQQIWILGAMMIAYSFPCMNNFFDIMGADIEVTQYIRNISFMFLLMSGAMVNIVRLVTDPYVLENTKLVLSKIRNCDFSTIEESESAIDVWNSSLNNVVIQFQNESIIQNIIFIVEEVSQNEENDDLMGSTIKMNRNELDLLLMGKERSKLEKATKLKKKIQTRCVEYLNNSVAFRNTVINYSTVTKQNEPRNDYFRIKATALAYYVFERIRQMDGLTNQKLSYSLNLEKNAESIKQTKQSLGASGSFFFFTFDKRLIIKTITSQQQQCLLGFLPDYYIHLLQNPNTLLSKIYGIYNVEIGNTSKITFLLMENSFYNFDLKRIKYQIYDMKGSLVKREVKNPMSTVQKDVNFLKSNQPFIFMSKEEKQEFMSQVNRDITMLAEMNIMDYSLLLGVMPIDDKEQHSEPFGVANSWKWVKSGSNFDQRVYSISIIDYLQKFNCQKYSELKFKTFFSPSLDVSCIDTIAYRERYLRFLNNIIIAVNQ